MASIRWRILRLYDFTEIVYQRRAARVNPRLPSAYAVPNGKRHFLGSAAAESRWPSKQDIPAYCAVKLSVPVIDVLADDPSVPVAVMVTESAVATLFTVSTPALEMLVAVELFVLHVT